MTPEILSSSLAAVAALGIAERLAAATAFVLYLGALVAIRRFLEARPSTPVRPVEEDRREAA